MVAGGGEVESASGAATGRLSGSKGIVSAGSGSAMTR